MSVVPSLREFREHVDHIPRYRDSIVVKVAYLTAARVSELTTKISPSDIGTTKPYGKHQTCKFADYQGEKVLLITQGVLKRKEKKGRPVMKTIALPMKQIYEPWTIDLLKYMRREEYLQRKGKLCFDLTRQGLTNIIKRSLREIIPRDEPQIKNRLRHYRLSHLVENYEFSPYDLTAYAGWTIRAGFSKLGVAASPQMDYYVHFAWRQYFTKLLKPIHEIINIQNLVMPDLAEL